MRTFDCLIFLCLFMTTLSLTPAPGKDNAFDNALDEQYSTRMTTLKKYGNNQFRNYIIALKSGERGDELDFWEQFLKMHLCQEGREKMELLAQSRPVVKNYSHTIGMGFLVEMNTIALKMVEVMPDIDFVEEDGEIHSAGNNTSPLWHLDRINQRRLPLDGKYSFANTGKGIDIYIIDSGIRYSHAVFAGRASFGGFDAFGGEGEDCSGHGTAVAGLAAGSTIGVAVGANVYSIKVLDCNNGGKFSSLIRGIDFVINRTLSRDHRSIISLSLIGPRSNAVNAAIKRAYDQGIVTITAAGNYQRNACNYSPASSPLVITVGGTDQNDDVYWTSQFGTNYGHCVDIFAPVHPLSASHTSLSHDIEFDVKKGTSYSSAIVVGVVALLLEEDAMLTPKQVKEKLLRNATKNAIDFSKLPYQARNTTANLMVFVDSSTSRKFPRLPDEKNFNTSQLAPAARNETVTTYIVTGILAFLFSGSTIVLCIAIICYCCQKNRHCKRILPSLQRGSLSSSRNSYSAPISNEIQLEDATIPHNKVSTKSDNHQCTIKDEHTVKLMAPKSDVSSPFHLHQSESTPHLLVYSKEEIQRLEKIGKGSFWKVYRGTVSGNPCAIKRLKAVIDSQDNTSLVKNVQHECDIWSSFRHPNIVRVYGLYYESEILIPLVVMELMHKSLTTHLSTTYCSPNRSSLFPLSGKISILLQVVQALEYLHVHQRIVHGDLTANNVLNENPLGSFVAKLTDFGTSHLLDKHNVVTSTMQGTYVYMPPEIHNADLSSNKVDIYSFGVLCVHILTHKLPNPLHALSIDQLGSHVAVSEFMRYSHSLMELSDTERLIEPSIERCLQYAPTDRPQPQELLEHLESVKMQMNLDHTQSDSINQCSTVNHFHGPVISGCSINDSTINLS